MKLNIKLFLFLVLSICLSGITNAGNTTNKSAEIRRIIDKVNTKWQRENTPLTDAFWHNAAYHTGNMEVYQLTGNPDYLAY